MPELLWEGKPDAVAAAKAVPYRLLEADDALSYGEANTENMIIQGDNLATLKALLPYYKGSVRCIYADPPYNTGSAFEHYDDNLEHSTWLSLMYPRLELMRDLLSEDGSIWISIDDTECHYLKVICDEIFGRDNFIVNVVWQKRYSRENREAIGDSHDHILVYAINPALFKKRRNKIPMNEAQSKVYKNPNNDPRGRWRPVPMTAQAGHATPDQFYKITSPGGKVHTPPKGRCWALSQKTFEKMRDEGRIYFGKNNNGQPNIIRYLSEVPGVTPWSWWSNDECGHTDEAKKEILALFGGDNLFDTPKPERLLKRIIEIATTPNDLVLDAFLGSGTTAAVAQKMNRKYIGIEMGDHAVTHVVPRMKKVIDGEQGGISKAEKWEGGGGFRFYRLGEQLFDEFQIIRPDVKFPQLAAHIWFTETHTPYRGTSDSPMLGIHQGTAYYLLYNGILGDKKPQSGNVLTSAVLKMLPPFDGPKVIYGEANRFGPARMQQEGIIFKQIPTEILTF